jgi:cell fate (sporulation/competence/biofilm development) regulator YmcA (YheA/YmcA/DUF963 family)
MAASKQTIKIWLWITGLVWLLAIASLVYTIVVVMLSGRQNNMESALSLAQQVQWGYALTVFFTLGALGLSCMTGLMSLARAKESVDAQVEAVRKLQSGQTDVQAILTQISENVLLSDAVKSIAFRENDHTVLREAIEEDLKQQRWNSAASLIEVMAKRFGSREEAMHLRAQLEQKRKASIEAKIDAAIKHIESLWMIHSYEEAQQEVNTLLQLYPTSEKALNLQGETKNRRQAHKKELLERWNKAVKDKDFEQGVELLKLLDKYMTTEEAAQLQESARGVFKGKLQNMGVQFSLFVTEKKWTKALQVGKQIIEEFPMSRMAQEVQEKLEVLEQRAQGKTE